MRRLWLLLGGSALALTKPTSSSSRAAVEPRTTWQPDPLVARPTRKRRQPIITEDTIMRPALLRFGVCAALLVGLSQAPARADGWDRLTYFTFSSPVQLPGVTLNPGTYEFRLVNPESGGSVMRVASQDGSNVSKLFFMIRGDQLDNAPNDPFVVLRETAAGQPPALKGWFYPGQETGFDFVYSHRQAIALNGGIHSGTHTASATTRILIGSTERHGLSAKHR
jgi:hypothetical protein